MKLANPKIDLPTGPLARKAVEYLLDQRLHFDRLPRQRLPAKPRERKQVIDEPAHLLGACADVVQQLLAIGWQLAAVIVEQDAREAVDCAEWRAQIVRHSVGK